MAEKNGWGFTEEQRIAGTKSWCEDMMEKYLDLWSADDQIYKDLKRFHEENIVNTKSTMSQEEKEKFLEVTAKKINKMYNELMKTINN
jgi:hypothetical protein